MKVKKHLTINLGGIKEGDFTFVMGFPGRNWRYMISDEVEDVYKRQDYEALKGHIKCNPSIKTLEDRNALRKALSTKIGRASCRERV